MSNQFSLLKQKRFAPFFWTQFLGALNDNVYKNALVIMLAFQATSLTTISSDVLINLSGGLFILPFFLFSATAGQLADKYEKSRIIRYVKLLEIAIMASAAVGFYLQNIVILIGALFMMGLHSTIFGPVKYSILPQHLRQEELIGGNGLVEMGTFVAILVGTILGGILVALRSEGQIAVSVVVITIAFLGYFTSRSIPHSPAPSPALKINWNPITETWRNLKFTKQSRTVFLSILGISWFWFYGVTFLSQFPNLSKKVIHGDEHIVTLFLTIFSIGVGAGSLLCERVSGRRVEIGLVPFGAFGLTIFAIDFYFATQVLPNFAHVDVLTFLQHPAYLRLALNLFLIGLFGGFFIVPLYTLIQLRSNPEYRSRIIAGNNILNALFMVVAAVVAIGLLSAGVSIPMLLLITGILNALIAIYIFTLVPEFLMRFLVWMLVHTIYRLKKVDLTNIPDRGAAILVCNHVSYADAPIIAAACMRPIRFIMDYQIYKIPILHFIFKTTNAIPIASLKKDPAVLEQAFDEITKALERGELICIFPEGKITDTGDINQFKSGIEQIVKRTPVNVVPMALRGLWGSLFSRHPGKRFPGRLFSNIELVVGMPIAPEEVSAQKLQEKVRDLRADVC